MISIRKYICVPDDFHNANLYNEFIYCLSRLSDHLIDCYPNLILTRLRNYKNRKFLLNIRISNLKKKDTLVLLGFCMAMGG